ncbi:hypothetical protein LX95_00109 [Mesonia algae]|uniref:Uncharacterized protein n=1 Tax=Mesonia algae TaxID=213248 RepID=A0A2W7IF93_9FLAO|nr:hypothetical protein [Mesonia algae]PZW43785.1 hypothetical protein LX95_00109 [Mesonia algae]
MGEIIKVLVKKEDGFNFEIELNKANSIYQPRMIHLQNEKGRIQFTEAEFITISSVFLEAINNFKILKKINE